MADAFVRIFTRQEMAEHLGISLVTLRNWMARGLPSGKMAPPKPGLPPNHSGYMYTCDEVDKLELHSASRFTSGPSLGFGPAEFKALVARVAILEASVAELERIHLDSKTLTDSLMRGSLY